MKAPGRNPGESRSIRLRGTRSKYVDVAHLVKRRGRDPREAVRFRASTHVRLRAPARVRSLSLVLAGGSGRSSPKAARVRSTRTGDARIRSPNRLALALVGPILCCVMRLASQLDCRSSETSSILVRSATRCVSWRPIGFQIRGAAFDSLAPCGDVRWSAVFPCKKAQASSILDISTRHAGMGPRGEASSLVRTRDQFDSGCRSVRTFFRVRRNFLRAFGVNGSMAGFQPAGDGSIPSTRTTSSCSRGVASARRLHEPAQHRVQRSLQTIAGSDRPRRASPRYLASSSSR